MQAALFVWRDPVHLAHGHFAGLMGSTESGVLAGGPVNDRPVAGRTVCASLNVRINTILRAVSERQLLTFEAIGAALCAGTNCGSCRPELAAIIARQTLQVAAE